MSVYFPSSWHSEKIEMWFFERYPGLLYACNWQQHPESFAWSFINYNY